MQFPIHIPFIVLSILIGLFVLIRHGSPLYLVLFLAFLGFTLYIEIQGHLLSSQGRNTAAYFNIFSIIALIAYLYLLSNYIKSPLIRTLILISAVIYSLVAIVNLIFFQGLHEFNTVTYAVNSLLIIIFSVCFFFELFTTPKATSLAQNEGFWIATGLLIFNACTIPVLGIINYISKLPRELVSNIQMILRISNVLLYLFFTIAFLCRKNIPKSM